jgi:hypothetical protein
MARFKLLAIGAALFLAQWSAHAAEPDKSAPWGEPVDGLACRLVLQQRYVVGQPITATIEVKNTSDKKRYFVPRLDPQAIEWLTLEVNGPSGKVNQTRYGSGYGLGENSFQPIGPGEVQRFEVTDLRSYFRDLIDWSCYPEPKANAVATGKYTLQFKFRSPKVPDRFVVSQTVVEGKLTPTYKDAPKELIEGQWSKEAVSAPVAIELAPLGKDDLVVHEWGVFTVFNDVKYANVNRKEEWGSLPSFFYRQFPKERLRWMPAGWDKPVIYFYSKPESLHVNVKVTFADGAPVVWWPAVSSPVDSGVPPGAGPKKDRPFRSLTWEAWLGDSVATREGVPPAKVDDFPLPESCWLKEARLPGASHVTVIGNEEGLPKGRKWFPGALDRSETERFLYYDGLVPAPDYIRCDKIDDTSLTLRNRAKFDVTQLFVVDRRSKDTVGFAYVDGKETQLKAGATIKIEPKRIAAKDWPAAGLKQVKQALRDAGLFEAEADSLLKIWSKGLLEADGVTAFHILPIEEYDRMLPLSVLPAPPTKPVRVGIALHPHVEIEPVLSARAGELIKALDSEDFEKRAAASKELLEIGPLAIALMRDELKKKPALEVAKRIEEILEKVDAAEWLKIGEKTDK